MRQNFHRDGGTDLFSTAQEYAKSLKENLSILKNPATGRFHVIRKFDVQRRINELGWILYATVELQVVTRYHVPDTSV